MPVAKRTVKRTRPRVDVDEAKSTSTRAVRKDPEHRGGGIAIPLGDGRMLLEYAASELVPVASYASVTIGPVKASRIVTDPDPDEEMDKDEYAEIVAGKLEFLGQAVQTVIMRDRAVVEESVRLHEEREAAEEAAKKKR